MLAGNSPITRKATISVLISLMVFFFPLKIPFLYWSCVYFFVMGNSRTISSWVSIDWQHVIIFLWYSFVAYWCYPCRRGSYKKNKRRRMMEKRMWRLLRGHCCCLFSFSVVKSLNIVIPMIEVLCVT